MTTTVYRVDLSSGERAVWKVLAPADRAGVLFLSDIRISADERSYAYSSVRRLGELYLVDGLR